MAAAISGVAEEAALLNLEGLGLCDKDIDADFVENLNKRSSVTRLILRLNNLTSASAVFLNLLEYVKYIDLSNNNFDETCAPSLLSNLSIESFNFQHNNIRDARLFLEARGRGKKIDLSFNPTGPLP
jgi:hypothetical protein